MMDVYNKKRSICIRGSIYDFSEPRVMGVFNCTPDSFYDGGRFEGRANIIDRISKMTEQGADIIDIGAVSSRPGAVPVTEAEEVKRLTSVLNIVRGNFPDLIISVDTFRPDVARIAVEDYRVDIINDISSGTLDINMLETIARLQVPFIAMHMKGTPDNMQLNPEYNDVTGDIIRYFSKRVSIMRSIGIKDIIIDPGFGFGKTLEHNYNLLGKLEDFGMFDLPLLAGLSRKSMICKVLGVIPENALAGTVALNAIAILKGADILRVHDVGEACDTIKVVKKIRDLSVKTS